MWLRCSRERGFVFTHETVRDWEKRFAPLVADQLRRKRRGQAGRSWYVDETYIKVHGRWCSLYRAIDADGNLVDSRLSERRDTDAAQQFFKQAVAVVGHAPKQVTTDGHRSYPCAIREIMGIDVLHRTNVYLNNRIEQDHRGIKQRYYPMRGFGTFASAARFCRAFDARTPVFPPSPQRKRTYSTGAATTTLPGATCSFARTDGCGFIVSPVVFGKP
jgi:putative transposase